MSAPPHPISPPPPAAAAPASTGVRRHHTITATSRSARAGSRPPISEESHEQQTWNDDEVVDQDWVGAVGAVGEKGSLHRQASLPTRYNRAYGQGSRQSGTITPRTLNSLTAIAGQEGDEEDWEREMARMRSEEEAAYSNPDHPQHQQMIDSQSGVSPLSPHFHTIPSPPPAGSGVRRHQSLTYGAATGGVRRMASSGLKRAGTLQAQIRAPGQPPQSPSPTNAEEEYEYDEGSNGHEDEAYFSRQPSAQAQQAQSQYPTSPIGRSPWSTPSNEWRTPAGSSNLVGNNSSSNVAIDDVQRALSSLDINHQQQQQQQQQNQGYSQPGYPGGQSAHPPRFNPPHPPPQQMPGMRPGANGGGGGRKLQLVTDLDGRNAPLTGPNAGPVSASAYVPPIGQQPLQQQQQQQQQQRGGPERDERAYTASGAWDQKERVLQGRTSNPNLNYMYAQQQQQQGKPGAPGVPNVPTIPAQYLQQGMGGSSRMGVAGPGQGQAGLAGQQAFLTSPVDVPTLIATKGYNPANFDVRPTFARYFVIKSYMEDDVHKSLKYEIWSSTDPGNKRLDKAFKETAGRGPIYLFFSVNASGHFCGMAEMLTPVDYTRSSTVWASDKWKGVFKVRWIFVRDIPNANLRHIRLNNTQERKPVTNSRDTQELLPDAGQEMLRIFHTHPARTSLLQDFAFYELQSMQKMQTGPVPPQAAASPQGSSPSPPQQHAFAAINQANTLAYASHQLQMPQITPMMQMQMASPFVSPHAMHSVMRNPSPVPVAHGQGYMGMSGVPGFSS